MKGGKARIRHPRPAPIARWSPPADREMPSLTRGCPGGLGAGHYFDGNRGPLAAMPRSKSTRFIPGPSRCVTLLVISRATHSGKVRPGVREGAVDEGRREGGARLILARSRHWGLTPGRSADPRCRGPRDRLHGSVGSRPLLVHDLQGMSHRIPAPSSGAVAQPPVQVGVDRLDGQRLGCCRGEHGR